MSEAFIPHSKNNRRIHQASWTATRALHAVASNAHLTAALTATAVLIANLFGIGPQWAQLSDTGVLAFTLAAYGAATIVDQVLTRAADAIDPDSYDGDTAFLAATVLRDLASDVDNGADIDHMRIAIQDSRVLAEAGCLLTNLATAYDRGDEDLEAGALHEAASYTFFAAQALGDKQI